MTTNLQAKKDHRKMGLSPKNETLLQQLCIMSMYVAPYTIAIKITCSVDTSVLQYTHNRQGVSYIANFFEKEANFDAGDLLYF